MTPFVFGPAPATTVRQLTFGALTAGGSWQMSLAHDRPEHLLIWMTRGQGLALLDGARRGIGVHNAIFVPARSLFSIDPGRQGFAQAVILPEATGLSLPRTVQHLRIRDASAQSELTAYIEAMAREQSAERSLTQSALHAYAELICIWLRRNIEVAPEVTGTKRAARTLMRAYSARITTRFASGAAMQDHAEALGVTPTHLTRVCRAETGRTAAALLTERILHAARTMLVQTDMSAKDIARHLGFGSAAYFTRFIQQHTGRTPTMLRRGVSVPLDPALPRKFPFQSKSDI